MLSNKVITSASTLIALIFMLLGVGNIYGALFTTSDMNVSVLSPISPPKVTKVELSSFQLDPTAFTYDHQKISSVISRKNTIGIESAKLMGTVIGNSKEEHVAFVALPNSSRSEFVKIGDEVMGHVCLSITQHDVTFENVPNPLILRLSGFEPERISVSPGHELTESSAESVDDSETSESAEEYEAAEDLTDTPEISEIPQVTKGSSKGQAKKNANAEHRPFSEKMKSKRKKMRDKKIE